MNAAVLAVLLLLTACGGSDEPVPEEGRAVIDPPNCAASGACR